MVALRGRRKCSKCGKKYGWYYAKPNTDEYDKVKYKGKSDNACIADEIKILSRNSSEVRLHCPECGEVEIFVHTE